MTDYNGDLVALAVSIAIYAGLFYYILKLAGKVKKLSRWRR